MTIARSIQIAAASIITLIALLPSAEGAAPDNEYNEGLKAYAAKNYQAASEHFGKSIQNGNKSAAVWLYSGHCFVALGQIARANQTYEIITKSFKGTEEAKSAAASMEAVRARGGAAGNTPSTTTSTAPGASAKGTAVPVTPGAEGLITRIFITAPQFSHKPVSQATINAAKEAVAALPAPLRKKLDDDAETRITISPNMIDRWPESAKDLPEDNPALTMAELPGRIYGKDMNVYERPKFRGSTALKDARPPKFIRLQVGNMCFQLLDDMMTISKDPALRKEWEADKENVPPGMVEQLATFMKEDDWGPRETCSELFGSMIGGYDENTEPLYRYFTRTKKWLAAKMGLK